MTDLYQDTAYFEGVTACEVTAACLEVMPGMSVEVVPSMFDASVIVRHDHGRGPTAIQADRIASVLRQGRPLRADVADWHASPVYPYCDALDRDVVYGSIFGLIRAFLPSGYALDRSLAAA